MGDVNDGEGVVAAAATPAAAPRIVFWKMEYRCRRCAFIDRSLGGPHDLIEQAVMFAAVAPEMLPKIPGVPVGLHSTHLCADGGYAISDLIGAAPEPADTESALPTTPPPHP